MSPVSAARRSSRAPPRLKRGWARPVLVLALLAGCAQHGGAPASPYAGQQGREISAPSSGRSAASDGSVPAR